MRTRDCLCFLKERTGVLTSCVCIEQVVMEFRERGMEFVLEVLNRPNYLEDLTGLTELLSATHSMSLEWDDDTEEADDLEL